jgi:hypothetical protein
MKLQVMCALLSCAAMAAAGKADATEPAPVQLKLAGTLPFTAQELDEVVAARVATGGGPDAPVVLVGPAPDAGIEVRLDDRVVIVAVGDERGITAARLVAIAIADLVGRTSDAVKVDVEASAPPAQRPALAAPDAAAPAAPPVTSGSTQIGAALQMGRGVGEAEPAMFGVGADVLLAQGWLVFGAGAGAARAPTRRAGRPDEVTLTAATARVWLGARVAAVDLLVGPLAAPYQIEGTFSHTGALFGAGALVRYHRPIGARMQLTAALRADAFANRVRVTVGDLPPSLVTPRLALALDIGLAWELGR